MAPLKVYPLNTSKSSLDRNFIYNPWPMDKVTDEHSCCKWKRRRGMNTYLFDTTAITLDLNWFKKTYLKAQLEKEGYKWGYSSTHEHYIGYKLTPAFNFHSLQPVCLLLHLGSPHDYVIFNEIMTEIKRCRITPLIMDIIRTISPGIL